MLQQIFIPPTDPFPILTAEWIVENLYADLPKQRFQKTLVLVPTKSSGKNLREELFELVKSGAIETISGLYIETFEEVIAQMCTAKNIASYTERIGAWLKAIEDCNQLRCIFPHALPRRENLFETAKELDCLAAIVSEKLMSFQDVLDFLKKDFLSSNEYEISLWSELSSIEKNYRKNLESCNLKCKYRTFAETIRNAKINYNKIIVAINPDAPYSLKEFLENATNYAQTFVLIAANENQKNNFDIIGRPIARVYENEPIDISQKNTFVFSSVSDEAEAVAELASQYGNQAQNILGISCQQSNNADIFKEKIARKNLRAEVPQQRKLSQSMLFKLLKASAIAQESNSFFEFVKVLENPLLSQSIAKRFSMSESAILEVADDVRERLVPSSTDALLTTLFARGESENFELLNYTNTIIAKLSSENPLLRAETAQEIIESYTRDVEDDVFNFEKATLQALVKCSKEIDTASRIYKFCKNDVSKMIFEYIENSRGNDKDFSDCILLNDWIEIFWSRKPHLLLCDMNDGIVPLTEMENQFITDSLKRRLGLKNSVQRRARDAYMLSQLFKTRPNAVQILFSTKDASQAPIMPSRILMQADDLPMRIKFLFQEPQASKIELSAPTLLPLKINGFLDEKFSMSASKLNSYLNSPLDFYINYILKSNEVSPDKSELDSLQYGNILHLLMKKFALSEVRNSQKPSEILNFLDRELKTLGEAEFGAEMSAQIRIQLFTLRQKLSAIATIQSIHASNGWRIWGRPERTFKLTIDSMTITGAIDRIDYNKNLNKYAIIDYKTHNKFSPKITQQTHFKKLDENDNPVWENLQMPLYLLALRQLIGECECDCAFFVSPQETSETAIDFWEISDEILDSAYTKIQEIIKDIRNGRFLPETPPKYDVCKNTFDLSGKTLLSMMRK